jgi:transposase InsO family protein
MKGSCPGKLVSPARKRRAVEEIQGLEFLPEIVRQWREDLGVQTAFIASGSPWENGYIAPLNGEIVDTVIEAKVITE